MITSKVQVCNMALAAIGTRSSIANLTENSAEANACLAQYDAALEAVLQAAHWNFARKQASLTLIKDATATPPGTVPIPWLYEYAYPSDCVQAISVMPLVQSSTGQVPAQAFTPLSLGRAVRFMVTSDADANNNDAKVIVTNQTQAMLVYTKRITNVALFDGQFTLALANYLGALICMGLTGDRGRRDSAFELANSMTINARASNGNEGITVIDSVADWIRVRGYEADFGYPPGDMFWASPVNLSLIV